VATQPPQSLIGIMFSSPNKYGNILSSFENDAYRYVNADGSRFFSNPDGSKFYDPGPSGKGRKWYCSPDGEKHYIDDPQPVPQPKSELNLGFIDGYDVDSDDTMYLESPSKPPSISPMT
jgi:hypothetical protein